MIRHCSTVLCAAVAVLVALGLIMLTSTGAWVKGFGPYHFLSHQAIMVGVGLIAAIIAVRFNVEHLRKFAPWLYGLMCLTLVLCYIPGIGVSIYGSKRWLQLPGLGQFQPSEMSRIIIVICLATWFARWQTEVRTFWRGFVIPGLIAGFPIMLIAAEPAVGIALSLSVVVGSLMFSVGTRLRYAVPTALSVITAAGWFIYHDENRWNRIQTWLDLEHHTQDRGMQQWRALLALGNGGPTGVGLGNGVEKFGTLTFAHIDFIFPEVGEELGLVATLFVVVCYVLIAVAGCGIALQAKTMFNRCLALGLTCLIVVPAMENIAVTTAMLPNDGLPLPFVSFGGTSILLSLAAVGILVGIHRRSLAYMPQEFPLARERRLALRL